jgi:hypothetical protein
MFRNFVSVVLMFILLSLFLYSSGYAAPDGEANGYLGQNIDTNAEYTSGSIPTPYGGIWYVWINVSETKIIQYSLFSNEYNSPIMSFLGQSFQIGNGTEVFVGNTLTLIEVYNDTSGDGIPQANFVSGESEIVYYLLVNSSINYQVTPIQKILEDGILHYKWGFKYQEIDGFLFYPEEQPGIGAARVMIDHLGFNYDFCVVENTSYVETSFDIGRISDVQPMWGEPPVSLDGLSLSLLFSTVTISDKTFTAYVNGEPYNSKTTADSATAADSGQIAVEMVKAYEFLFGETYDITIGENVVIHEVTSEAASTMSVPQGAYSSLNYALAYFEDNLNISDLIPSAEGIEGNVNLDYDISALLYRICYPKWDGLLIQHDPTYVAHLFGNEEIPEFSSWIILPLFIIGIVVIIVCKKRLTKKLPV